MDLDFTEEQEMLREMVRGVCSSYAPLETVRALEDDPIGYPPELWKQLARARPDRAHAPDRVRRLGHDRCSTAPSSTRSSGRALAPSPHFVSAVMSAGALLRAGSDEQRRDLAAADRDRRRRSSPRRGSSPTTASARAACDARPRRADGDGFVLDGVKWHVPFADGRDPPRRAGPHRRRRDVDLFLVDPRRRGRHARPAADDRLRHAVPGDASRRAVPAEPHRRRRLRAGRPGTTRCSTASSCSPRYAMGGARVRARDHGAVREGPRSSSTSRSARSRRSRTTSPTRRRPSRAARSSCTRPRGRARTAGRSTGSRRWRSCSPCQTFRDVTAMAQQVFGGVGFTIEYDIQLYFRRAKQLQISWWDDRYLEELVADSVIYERATSTTIQRSSGGAPSQAIDRVRDDSSLLLGRQGSEEERGVGHAEAPPHQVLGRELRERDRSALHRSLDHAGGPGRFVHPLHGRELRHRVTLHRRVRRWVSTNRRSRAQSRLPPWRGGSRAPGTRTRSTAPPSGARGPRFLQSENRVLEVVVGEHGRRRRRTSREETAVGSRRRPRPAIACRARRPASRRRSPAPGPSHPARAGHATRRRSRRRRRAPAGRRATPRFRRASPRRAARRCGRVRPPTRVPTASTRRADVRGTSLIARSLAHGGLAFIGARSRVVGDPGAGHPRRRGPPHHLVPRPAVAARPHQRLRGRDPRGRGRVRADRARVPRRGQHDDRHLARDRRLHVLRRGPVRRSTRARGRARVGRDRARRAARRHPRVGRDRDLTHLRGHGERGDGRGGLRVEPPRGHGVHAGLPAQGLVHGEGAQVCGP